jgi:LPXTG-motif cell wall-anchored protein
MSYIRTSCMGLSGAESCGANQIWSPDYVFQGVKGQCLSLEQYKAWEAQKAAAAAGVKPAEKSWWESLIGGATEVLKAKVTPAPVTQITTTAPDAGMSTTTKVAIAGAAALGLVLLLRKRK